MEPLMHWIIPTAILLAFFPKLDRRTVLLLSPLSFIMDFDKFISYYHRVLFYNIFFFIIIILILYYTLGKQKTLIGAYFMISHLLFDLSFPGIGLFWPLIKKLYYFDFNITYDNSWIFDLTAGSIPFNQSTISEPSYFMYTHGFLIFILIVFTAFVYYYTKNESKP